jgi:hypothetical protein
MPNDAEIARRVDRAKKQLADYSKMLEAERQRDQLFFPSLAPGDRGAVSPLGGLAEWPWGRREERRLRWRFTN